MPALVRFGFAFLIAAGVWNDARAVPHVDPWALCADAVARAEQMAGIPRHLLGAISLAESGRTSKRHEAHLAWPWTVMAERKGRYLPTKAAAIAEVEALQRRGVRNIDVGCMQVNLKYHPEAFANLHQALDPSANANYAASFLRDLHRETGSWPAAAGRYHSATLKYNRPYKAKVAKLWNKLKRSPPQLMAATDSVATRAARPVHVGSGRAGARHARSRLLFGDPAAALRRDKSAEARFEARRKRQLANWRSTVRRVSAAAQP